jgi:glycolate oxidase iron-sulfur subunit
MNLNEDILKEALKCVKCGSCLSVCPVYKELCEEPSSPRGRAALAEEVGRGELGLTQKLIEVFTKCLACGSCEEVCSKGIPVTKIIYEVREMLYQKKHYDPVIHSVIKLMYRAPYVFSLLLKNAAVLRPLLFKDLGEKDLLRPRIRLPFMDKHRMMPKVKVKFFLDNYFFDKPKSKDHISLFTGCIFNYIYPDIAKSSLNILKGLGKEVHVTPKQICCGFPALSVGNFHSLKENVLKNIDILDETHPEKIIVLCSSCSLMFKKYYQMVFDDEKDSIKEKVRKFSDKVIDFTSYINDRKDKLDKIYNVKEKANVTFHTPCHLSKGLNFKGIIKEIFDGKKNVCIKDLNTPEACCGFGGIFNYRYSDLSLKISERKIKEILDTKAEIVLTSCSGCIVQLKEGLIRHGSNVEVLHISEFIAGNKL